MLSLPRGRRALRSMLRAALALFAAPLTVLLAVAVVPGTAPLAAQGAPVEIHIASTTDVHGRLRGWDYIAGAADPARGLARVATIVDSLRRAAPGRVVLVDAGDNLQGNAMTFAARLDSQAPSPVIAAMNAMRYDAAAVGNHEFNYGIPFLDRARRGARFPHLAANAERLDGGAPFTPQVMVERGGVKVAIIGVTNPGAMLWDRDLVGGRIRIGDIVAALPAQVRAARAQGAEVVVVVAHAGLSGTSFDTTLTGVASENPMARVAREVPGIDVIVVGHSHREVADSTINGVLVVQPRNWATSLSVATITLDGPRGRRSITAKRGTLVQAAGHSEQQAVVRAVARAHERGVAYASGIIGRSEVVWRTDSARVRDVPLIDFIQEVQRRVTGAQLSAASAFTLDATIPAGEISVARMAQLYPYENSLRAVKLSGTQVRAYLEHAARYWSVRVDADGTPRAAPDPRIPGYDFDIMAGVDYAIDLSRPVGGRLAYLRFEGRDVLPSDTFTVALNSYRASGSGGYSMVAGAPVTFETSREIREILVDEVRGRGVLRPADFARQNWMLLPPRRTLRVVALNDFHGALQKRPDGAAGNRGGAAELAAMVRRAAQECAPLCVPVVLHGGDLFQGTPASNLAFGAPVARILNALGVAAGAMGNHEFDWGQDTLRARMAQLTAPILGANVTYADGRDVPWIPDDSLLTIGGVRIGVVGIADPATPRTTMPARVADLRFAPTAPVVIARSRALRARGAAKVILVAHLGGFCERADPDKCTGEIFDLARATGPDVLDAIVSGHTHSAVNTVVNGVPIVQARSSGRAIGVIDLPLAREGDAADAARPAPSRPEVRSVTSDSITPDPEIAAMVDAAVAEVAPKVAAPVVEVAERLPREGEQYALGNLIADAQRVAGRGDLAVMNNGGIRADLQAGPARWGDLYEIQPFENRLVAVTVRGDALRRYLEQLVRGRGIRFHISGATVEFDSSAADGSRIRRVTLANGARLDDRRSYRVIMTNFLASGGDGATLAQGTTVEELNLVDLDMLVRHLRGMPGGRLAPIDALRAPRLRRVP